MLLLMKKRKNDELNSYVERTYADPKPSFSLRIKYYKMFNFMGLSFCLYFYKNKLNKEFATVKILNIIM